jgi:hypothetical protein
MFGKRNQPALITPDTTPQDVPIDAAASVEGAELGTPAAPEAQQLGKMALWVPGEEQRAYFIGKSDEHDETSRVVVVDKRRHGRDFHLGIAGEIHAKGQERLKSPLSTEEGLKVLEHLAETTAKSAKEADDAAYKGRPTQEEWQKANDLRGDSRAVDRLARVLKGDTMGDVFGRDKTNKDNGMSVAERLDDLVARYAELTTPGVYINSMGGTVQIGDDREVHYGGYNGSSFYEAVRARQIWKAMGENPKECRLKVLETSEGQQPDSTWLIAGPAVVPEELLPAPVADTVSAAH